MKTLVAEAVQDRVGLTADKAVAAPATFEGVQVPLVRHLDHLAETGIREHGGDLLRWVRRFPHAASAT